MTNIIDADEKICDQVQDSIIANNWPTKHDKRHGLNPDQVCSCVGKSESHRYFPQDPPTSSDDVAGWESVLV